MNRELLSLTSVRFWQFLHCFWSKKCASHFCRDITNENNQFSKFKIKIYYSSKTANVFKGTVVNLTLTLTLDSPFKLTRHISFGLRTYIYNNDHKWSFMKLLRLFMYFFRYCIDALKCVAILLLIISRPYSLLF